MNTNKEERDGAAALAARLHPDALYAAYLCLPC
jgi:hypothetical protein